ncbi:MAG: tetratricopeptide repeat protein [Desulfobacterales bacterium]|nr:tetratricopeptide repeat protein [Desulfobacterales bacterium]
MNTTIQKLHYRDVNWQKIIMLVFAISILVLYGRVYFNQFIVYDDPGYLTQNTNVQQGITIKNIKWAFSTFEMANWHPLTWISYMVVCQVWGLNPFAHLFTNVLFHMANSILLLLVCQRVFGRFSIGLIVALCFAFNPVHVESVVWISERKDVMSVFFGLLCLLTYISYTKTHSKKLYIIMLILYILSLLSKPMLVTLPFIMFMLDIWPLSRFQVKAMITEKIPMIILSIGSCIITYFAQSTGGAVVTIVNVPLSMRFLSAFVSYLRYITKILWPRDLCIFYPYAENTLPMNQSILAVLIIVVLFCVAIYCMRKYPYAIFGWCWFTGTLVPVIGIVQVGAQSIADRYTYFPSIGLYIILAFGFISLWERNWIFKAVLTVFIPVYICNHCNLTWNQIDYWKNSKTLFSHAASVTRGNYVAFINIAANLATESNYDLAIAYCEHALRIFPDYSDAHTTLGYCFFKKEMLDKAENHFQRSLKIKPDNNPYTRINFALLLYKQKRVDEALAELNKAAAGQKNPVVCDQIGLALSHMQKYNESIVYFRDAVQMIKHDAGPYNNLGRALTLAGQADLAIPYLKKSLDIQPGNPIAYNNLGLAMMQIGDIEEALYAFGQAIKLDPNYAKARENLYAVIKHICQD